MSRPKPKYSALQKAQVAARASATMQHDHGIAMTGLGSVNTIAESPGAVRWNVHLDAGLAVQCKEKRAQDCGFSCQSGWSKRPQWRNLPSDPAGNSGRTPSSWRAAVSHPRTGCRAEGFAID